MRAHTVQEGSIHSPTFSKPVKPPPGESNSRGERLDDRRRHLLSVNRTSVSEQGSPQRQPMQRSSGWIANEFGFRSSSAVRIGCEAPLAHDVFRHLLWHAIQRCGAFDAPRSVSSPHTFGSPTACVHALVGGACARSSFSPPSLTRPSLHGPREASHEGGAGAKANRTSQRGARVIEASPPTIRDQLHPMLLPQFRQR